MACWGVRHPAWRWKPLGGVQPGTIPKVFFTVDIAIPLGRGGAGSEDFRGITVSQTMARILLQAERTCPSDDAAHDAPGCGADGAVSLGAMA